MLKNRPLIHRVAEFVVRYGIPFEMALMDEQQHNPDFAFLFGIDSPERDYYREYVYKLLQGQDEERARFQIFIDGPVLETSHERVPGVLDVITRRKIRDLLENTMDQDKRCVDALKLLVLERADAAQEVNCYVERLPNLTCF